VVHVVVREYDYLVCSSDEVPNLERGKRKAFEIPDKDFSYLERLMSGEESKEQSDDLSFFLKRTSWGRAKAFQIQSFVGVLQTPDGTQLEILPKHVDGKVSEEKGRAMLFTMLRYLRDASFNLGGDAHLKHAPMHLLDLFVAYFLQEINLLVKKGIRSDYVAREENQTFLKGKLLVNQHIRMNSIQQQRFYVSYDEYLPDRAENRLIHAALVKIIRLDVSASNQRLCRELMFVFDGIPISSDVRKDFSLCKFNRAMVHYRHALEWCRLILNDESAVPSAGSTQAISILFPMEKIFEDYVAAMLRRHLPPEYQVYTQASGKYLCEKPKKFRLRPDILIRKNDSKECFIADTKWKVIDANEINKGISQSDMYQLYAYGKKYQNEKDTCCGLFLIYPQSPKFIKEIENEFAFDFEEGLRLHCLSFDCDIGSHKSAKGAAKDFSDRLSCHFFSE